MKKFLYNFKFDKNLAIAFLITGCFFLLCLFSSAGFDWRELKYSGNAITTDEHSHIASGYYYLKTGKYFLNPEHPPLVKDISAIPLLFLNPILPEISENIFLKEGYACSFSVPDELRFSKNLELANAQWDWAKIFLFNPQNNPDRIAFWSRLSMIFFNTLLLLLVYVFLSKICSKKTSLIFLFLITFSQFDIAHGSLVAMDFMSSILQILTIITFAIYIKSFVSGKDNYSELFFTILFLSLALLAKFSSVILVPTLLLSGFIYIFFTKGISNKLGLYFLKFLIIGLGGLLFIAGYYYFHVKNMDNNEMILQIFNNYPKDFPSWGLDVIISLVIGSPFTKGLAEYLNGFLLVMERLKFALQGTYFMGNFYGSEGAGLLYFPILYLTKTSIGVLLLILFSMYLNLVKIFKNKVNFENIFRLFTNNILLTILFLFIYFYTVSTMSSNLQIGLRHIFPIIIAILLLLAISIDTFWEKTLIKKIKLKFMFWLIAIWLVISTIISFPFYLSYYNFFGGGTENGYKIATDSNYDWGQDVKLFSKWLNESDINKIYADVTTNSSLEYYINAEHEIEDYNVAWWGFPEAGSFIAVSIFDYQNNIYDDEVRSEWKYSLLNNNLIKKIGTTILVFQVPDDINVNKN